jgi:hypothetical protein
LTAQLTVEEVPRLIAATRSDQGRSCLSAIYALGLRLSEGLSLQVGDIDAARDFVHVHRGKGSVDRYVPLPENTLEALRRYSTTLRDPRLLFPAFIDSHGGGAGLAKMPIDVDASSALLAKRHAPQPYQALPPEWAPSERARVAVDGTREARRTNSTSTSTSTRCIATSLPTTP